MSWMLARKASPRHSIELARNVCKKNYQHVGFFGIKPYRDPWSTNHFAVCRNTFSLEVSSTNSVDQDRAVSVGAV